MSSPPAPYKHFGVLRDVLTLVTIVPSKAAQNPTITIDANLTGAPE